MNANKREYGFTAEDAEIAEIRTSFSWRPWRFGGSKTIRVYSRSFAANSGRAFGDEEDAVSRRADGEERVGVVGLDPVEADFYQHLRELLLLVGKLDVGFPELLVDSVSTP